MIKDKLKQLREKSHNDIFKQIITDRERGETLYYKNLLSYCSNQMLVMQGTAEQTAEYRYFRAVHKLLELKEADGGKCEPVRIGRSFDGGYVVIRDRESGLFSSDRIAYSLGICDDVSFDLALVKKGYEVYQYDHTIDALPADCKRFHWRKTGITGSRETKELKSLETVIREDGNAGRSGMLLKCDIEGSEWDMLADCTEDTLRQFDQIVIELHGILDHRKRVKVLRGLKKLSATHQAVHIHGNNNSCFGFCGKLVTPDVFEVTLLLRGRYAVHDKDIILPASLDQPCNPDHPEILTGRWNV